jgi:hypothetical protein
MTPGKGPAVLGEAVKRVWEPLFQLSHHPHKEDDERLKNYFNIHSGGSDATLAFQIQTFKAACDYADLTTQLEPATGTENTAASPATTSVSQGKASGEGSPAIHIDLHIHLPESKSRRDYEYIFEDIAKYILGKTYTPRADD